MDGKAKALAKLLAAKQALKFVDTGMILGLGTGSTASAFVEELVRAIRTHGWEIRAVATSLATEELARRLAIPMVTLEDYPKLDLTIDGADEFDSNFTLIKGAGGALLREKIVATASKHLLIIADRSKQVQYLGHFPLPVEILPFGMRATLLKIDQALGQLGYTNANSIVRKNSLGDLFVTDGGNHIVDCHLHRITDPEQLSRSLLAVPGVVEHGLFINMAKIIIVADQDETRILENSSIM